jgi:RNA polymerase sigma factor (sigma-70 family)
VNDQTDSQLLRAYAENRSEAAFTELVRRHVDFTYSAALRMVRDPHLAEDVTQGAFVALAKNAGQLTHRQVLSGWLHRTAQNIAAQTVRTTERRRAREQEAAAMNELVAVEPDASWEQTAPHLDDALGELGEADRDALLLRYFERKSAREMAQTLGVSDEAAQKRVSRAVERLREFFARRGVRVGASGLVVVISTNAVQAAPVGLAATISSAGVLAGITITAASTATATQAIAMTTLQKTLIVALVAAGGLGIYEARQASNLRSQVQTLHQQQSPLAEQIKNLQSERDRANRQLAALREDNARLNSNTAELVRLRGEVAMLRQNPARARSTEEETAQLRVALAKSQSTVERLEFEKLDQNIFEDMKQLVIGMRVRPRDYNGFMATNFDQFISELSVKTNANGSVAFSQSGNDLAMFEFVNVGQVNDAMPQKLIFRERIPRRTPDGNWTRIYGRADGSIAKRVSSTGDFELWESVQDRSAP